MRRPMLWLLALLLSACGENGLEFGFPETQDLGAAGQPVTITIPPTAGTDQIREFPENPTVVTQGALVTWSNTDLVAHTATSTTGVWDSGTIAAGQSFTRSFNEIGTFPYRCEIHPAEMGTLQVVAAGPAVPTIPVPSPTPNPGPFTGAVPATPFPGGF